MQLPELVPGKILRRYKRFFADVELASGEVVVAHVPNTGSMKTCWVPGMPAWLSPATNPERKLRWTLELTSTDGKNFVVVNTALANKLAFEALSARSLPPFAAATAVLPEQSAHDSRFDFKLETAEGPCWVEVKNVTLLEAPGVASFPDAVTTRGQKHLEDLIALRHQGQRAAMLYVVARSDAESFTTAHEIDPEYAALVSKAKSAGVEIHAFKVQKDGNTLKLAEAIPVKLDR